MAVLSIYHDTRRELEDKTYPVKLRLYCGKLKKTKFYKTGLSYTVKNFESIWISQRVKKIFKEEKDKIKAIETHSLEVLDKMQFFSFEEFEKRTFRATGDSQNVFYYYKEAIENFDKNGKVSTSETYSLSKKSFIKYLLSIKKNTESLPFVSVTVEWLNDYQRFMLDCKRSKTTISIYTRTLRAIFNKAIANNEIDKMYYPFGRGKFVPPSTKRVKKALNQNQLKMLFEAVPSIKEQQVAKDFWFFSFACNGMNIKDIALLTHDRLSKDSFYFYRVKTEHSNEDVEPIIVHLNDYSKRVIKEYGSSNESKYVFNILDGTEDAIGVQRKVKNYTRFINQHIKRLAKSLDIEEDISTYWARHSWAAKAIRSGKNIEFVGDAFGHSNHETTKGYFQGFEDEALKEFSDQLLKF